MELAAHHYGDFHDRKDVAALKGVVRPGPHPLRSAFPRPKGRGRIEGGKLFRCRRCRCPDFHDRKDVAALKGGLAGPEPPRARNFHDRKDVAALKVDHRSQAGHEGQDFHDRKDVAALKVGVVFGIVAIIVDFHDRKDVAALKVQVCILLTGLHRVFPRPKGRGRIEGCHRIWPQLTMIRISTTERTWPH